MANVGEAEVGREARRLRRADVRRAERRRDDCIGTLSDGACADERLVCPAARRAALRATTELRDEFSCTATIHMDPVSDDEATTILHNAAVRVIRDIDEVLKIHDFRVVEGPTHTNLIFDVVVPYGYKLTDAQVRDSICAAINERMPGCNVVLTVDKEYV